MNGLAIGRLSSRLEQLDRVPVGILDLDLLAAGSRLHVVPEMQTGFPQDINERRKILYPKNHTVPTARFLPLPVWHWPRSGGLRTAEQDLHIAK